MHVSKGRDPQRPQKQDQTCLGKDVHYPKDSECHMVGAQVLEWEYSFKFYRRGGHAARGKPEKGLLMGDTRAGAWIEEHFWL